MLGDHDPLPCADEHCFNNGRYIDTDGKLGVTKFDDLHAAIAVWKKVVLTGDKVCPGHVVPFDLAIDPDDARGLDDEALAKRMAASPNPSRVIKASACPMILPWMTLPRAIEEAGAKVRH